MPPEPNPDGSYTFSEEEIKNIRSYFEALKQPRITQDCRLEYIKEAQALLPSEKQQEKDAGRFEALTQKQIKEYEASNKPPEKSPELLAIEKALKERHEKDATLLAKSHRAEVNQSRGTCDNVNAVLDRHEKERQRLKTTYDADLKRYTQEHKEAQKLLKEMEERSAKESLKRDQSRRI